MSLSRAAGVGSLDEPPTSCSAVVPLIPPLRGGMNSKPIAASLQFGSEDFEQGAEGLVVRVAGDPFEWRVAGSQEPKPRQEGLPCAFAEEICAPFVCGEEDQPQHPQVNSAKQCRTGFSLSGRAEARPAFGEWVVLGVTGGVGAGRQRTIGATYPRPAL